METDQDADLAKPIIYFTKIADHLAKDLESGILSPDEYFLLVYMLQKADKNTGILITNSRILSISMGKDREKIRDILTALKRKKRIQNPLQNGNRDSTDIQQKRGSTRPYPILLNDALPIIKINRHSTEIQQTFNRDSDRAASNRIVQMPIFQASSGNFPNNDAATDKIRSAADKGKEESFPKGPGPVNTGGRISEISNSAAVKDFDYGSFWKKAVSELSETCQDVARIIFNTVLEVFGQRPHIYDGTRKDNEDTARDLSVTLSIETGWMVFVPAEKARNPYAFLRKTGAKPGHKWSRR